MLDLVVLQAGSGEPDSVRDVPAASLQASVLEGVMRTDLLHQPVRPPWLEVGGERRCGGWPIGAPLPTIQRGDAGRLLSQAPKLLTTDTCWICEAARSPLQRRLGVGGEEEEKSGGSCGFGRTVVASELGI